MQRQHSGNVRDVLEDSSQLAALPVQRRRPLQGRLKRAGSSGKFEKKGHYEACGTVKLLIAAAQTADVTHLEQAYSAEVGHTHCRQFVEPSWSVPDSDFKMLQGYDVVLAQDAQGVLEAVKAFPHPDLVLMTYTLPGLTGSQVSAATCCCPHSINIRQVSQQLAVSLIINRFVVQQVVRAIRRIHPDLPIFALSTSRENTASSIKQDLYGGALQDWLKLPVDDGEAVARTEGALRHQVLHLDHTIHCTD